MVVLTSIADTRRTLAPSRAAGRSIGFVPTMGALHDGHGRLIAAARGECAVVVVSVFVNPTQFNQRADFDAYPRVLDDDVACCERHGADIVFAPSVEEMYPSTPLTVVDVRTIGDHLCGRYRPGHFQGVATVVLKLLNIVQPDRAYFGEKDAQQLALVRRLVADLDVPVSIVGVPTVREPDGLAMSSRNRRLSGDERQQALGLYRLLQSGQRAVAAGAADPDQVKRQAIGEAALAAGVRLEYLEIVDPVQMQPVTTIEGPVRIAVAAWVGETRLIDNVLCTDTGRTQ